MPYRTNTFYSDPSIGRGVENLASALFGNPAEDAQIEQTLSRAKQIQQEIRLAREARDRSQSAADLFRSGDIMGGMAELLSTGQAGYAPHLGDVSLAFQANTPGATEDQIRRSYIGAGNSPPADFATTAGRADEIAGNDAAAALAQAEAVQKLKNLGTLQGVAANMVNSGQIPLDSAARTFDPYSVDERIAAEAPDAETAGRLRGYRDRGKGSGSGTADGGINWLEAQRRQELQNKLQTEVINQLIDMGLPADKNGARTDLLPPGLLTDATNEAWTNFMADMQTNSQPAPVSAYVRDALSRRVSGMEYTDDNNVLPFFGSEELTVRPAAVAAPAQPQQSAPSVPPPEQRVSGKVYNTPRGPMTWFVDPQTGQSGWLPGA
jgi:hypothetical protein